MSKQFSAKFLSIRSLLGLDDDDLFPHGAFKDVGPEILAELRHLLHHEGYDEKVIDCSTESQELPSPSK